MDFKPLALAGADMVTLPSPRQPSWKVYSSADAAAVLVVLGHGRVMMPHYIGSSIEYEIEAVGDRDVAKDLGRGLAPGAYLWTGTMQSSTSYEGEVDTWLEGDVRPLDDDELDNLLDEFPPWNEADYYTPEFMAKLIFDAIGQAVTARED